MIASAELAKVQSYIDGVLDGSIVTCKLVRASVQRHVDDLKRAEEDPEGFPYYFDPFAAECACEYFPTCLKHSIGRHQGMPFYLEPWQAFGVAMVMGWKRSVDNSRRFRKVYWSTGRKNGKSTFAGGFALQIASMDINPNTGKIENVATVILCATKREQVQKIMFAEIERMRLQSPEILAASTLKNQEIKFTANDGTIRCIGSDRPYDGLNPQMVCKDELHEFQHFHEDLLNTLDTGGGNRDQPIDIITTTAGDTSSYIWLDKYAYFRAVALGEIEDDTVFTWCFEIDEDDDPFDESVWIKANPNLEVSIKLDFLRSQAAQYSVSETGRNTFTRYHGNRVVSATEKAFDIDKWDACEGKLSDWSTCDAVGGGVDLGARDDFAAWGLVARYRMERERPTDFDSPEEEAQWDEWNETNPLWRYEIRSQAYLADDTKRDLTAKPFCEWTYNNLIKQSKFPLNDLQEDMADLCRQYGVADVAYDPYNGQLFGEYMIGQGIPTFPMPQTCAHFHEPIKDLRQAMEDGRLVHDGNPVLRWCFQNAVAIQDRAEHWMLSKRDSSEKIDMAVAVLMGYRRAMCAPARATGNLFVT